jgi:hypothetical protein
MPVAHPRLTLVAVPHPAMERTATFISAVLAACEAPVACTLETSSERLPAAGETAIYLRPDITNAAALTATADFGTATRLHNACSMIATFDDRCRHLPRLPWERLLADPHYALRLFAEHLQTRVGGEAYAAADAQIAALRSDVSSYDHPVPFMAALDFEAGNTAWVAGGNDYEDLAHLLSDSVPRTLLILAESNHHAVSVPVGDPDAWQISRAAIQDEAAFQPQGETNAEGIIYFHHVDAVTGIGDFLDRSLRRLAPGGLLCGREASEAAVENVVAKLTQVGQWGELTFILSGPRWFALPQGGSR